MLDDVVCLFRCAFWFLLLFRLVHLVARMSAHVATGVSEWRVKEDDRNRHRVEIDHPRSHRRLANACLAECVRSVAPALLPTKLDVQLARRHRHHRRIWFSIVS